jgi:hypothetical protein
VLNRIVSSKGISNRMIIIPPPKKLLRFNCTLKRSNFYKMKLPTIIELGLKDRKKWASEKTFSK